MKKTTPPTAKPPKKKNRKQRHESRPPGDTGSGFKPKHKRGGKPGGNPHRGASSKPQNIRDVSVLIITGTNEDGDLLASPAKWEAGYAPPQIVVIQSGRDKALSNGDRVLARMRRISNQLYEALVINILPDETPQTITGIFQPTAEGGLIEPISRKMKETFIVAAADTFGAKAGEVVSGVTLPGTPSLSMTYAKITELLGRLDAPRAASMIAAHMHNLPSVFSPDVIGESEAAEPPTLNEGRTDLRDIPLVTIDGEDARDFDDAVFAEKDADKNNPGGWHIVVAIADVAYYVREGSALDASAFERGNSVYFPDRVIPMLPERLSNGLCSLMPDVDRYCLAVHIWIDEHGAMQRYQFVRGLMRSRARLTYNIAQDAEEGKIQHPLYETVIKPLYEAYKALAYERDHRGALDLNLPEYKIIFDAEGNVAEIGQRERRESHRLIECFMIAANVASADYLIKQKTPGIYRVHEEPSEDKLEELKILLQTSGYSLHVGAGIKASHFNRVLKQAEGKPEMFMVNTSILRSQMQAYYSPDNSGHFGLGLQKYCHFTSPIRRYSDLIVHRSLAACIEGDPIKPTKQLMGHLAQVALHISDTERRAMLAERDASDRYKVSYMSKHVGATLGGVIVSLNEYGLYVALNDTGVNGFIPVRNLGGDFFRYDRRHASFIGQRTQVTFQIGMPLIIRVQTANPTTGTLIFELAQEVTPSGPLRPRDDKGPHRDKGRGKHRGSKDKKHRRN